MKDSEAVTMCQRGVRPEFREKSTFSGGRELPRAFRGNQELPEGSQAGRPRGGPGVAFVGISGAFSVGVLLKGPHLGAFLYRFGGQKGVQKGGSQR